MEKSEFWLLDVVVRMWYPLYLLMDEEVALVFNRPGHGLSHDQLVDTLHRLFQRGDLIAADTVEREPSHEFVPAREQIEAALVDEMRVYYGLTVQGGARWENYAKPNWRWYVNASYGTDENGKRIAEIEGSNCQRVQEYLSLHYEHYVMPDTTVHQESEEWEELVPWHIYYWRTLPKGYQVRFALDRGQDAAAVQRQYLQEQPSWVAEWLHNRQNWYTRYPGT
jgi:hypothetical protein